MGNKPEKEGARALSGDDFTLKTRILRPRDGFKRNIPRSNHDQFH